MPARPLPLRPRGRRVPRQAEPQAQRVAYLRALLPVVEAAHRALASQLAPLLAAYAAEQAQHADGWRADATDWGARFRGAIRSAAREALNAIPNAALAKAVRRLAGDVTDFQRQQLRRQFSEVLGVDVLRVEPDLKPTVERFTTENVGLIKSIPSDFFGQIEEHLMGALSSGARASTLATVIHERFGVAKNRAAFIANDQVGKLYASVDRERQQALGVRGYTWRTVHDNRVRPAHKARNGQHFTWDDPPEDGHPGHAPRCRCYSEPDVEDALTALLGEPFQKPLPFNSAPREPPVAAPEVVSRPDWKHGVFEVPLDELADVPSINWNPGRANNAERLYAQGMTPPPIELLEWQGQRELKDGNHRLHTARKLGLKTIPVRFLDRRAAEIRPNRPRGTNPLESLPQFAPKK